jgi:hypothetical protein
LRPLARTRLAPRHRPAIGEQRFQQRRRIAKLDTLIGEHPRHSADQPVGILRRQRSQQLDQPPVRPDGRKDLGVLHLPGHHHFADAFFFQDLDQPAQLPKRKPVTLRREPLDLGRCLFLNGQHHHLVPQAPRIFQR